MFEHLERSRIHLGRYTFDSLYFCQTPLAAYRGDQFCRAVRQWYLSAIVSGSAPPLSFLLDVGNLLLRPSLGFEHRPRNRLRPEVRELMEQYYEMLVRLRDQPIFAEVVSLLENVADTGVAYRAAGQFLKYLLVELHRQGVSFVFQSRDDFVLRKAKVSRTGLVDIEGHYLGERLPPVIVRDELADPSRPNEFQPLFAALRWIANFYREEPLAKFIALEERLMVELAARNPSGVDAVDFCLVKRLLEVADVSEPDEQIPEPRLVERVVPTESTEIDGRSAGYFDVHVRTFTGDIADIPSSEWALHEHPFSMYQKLINQGVLHMVRENIECIEKELRVLICFVVDGQPGMHEFGRAHHDFHRAGVYPYVRARALMATMLRDVARYFPRKDVRVEAALYLVNPQTHQSYRQHLYVFDAFPAEQMEDRLTFARSLAVAAPHFFDHRITTAAAQCQRERMDPHPFAFMQQRHRASSFHCRHVVLLTSQATSSPLIHWLGEPGFRAGTGSSNLNLVTYCDVDYHAARVCFPQRLAEAEGLSAENTGRLSETDLRNRFLEEILSKAAGRTAVTHSANLGGAFA